MSDRAWDAFFLFLGGAITGVIGIWTGEIQSGINARSQFKIFMSIKTDDIPTVSETSNLDEKQFWNFYKRIAPEIKNAVSAVKPFLKKKKVRRIEQSWSAFSKIDEEQLKDENELTDLLQEMRDFPLIKGFPKQIVPRKPSEILKCHFNSFLKSI